MKRIGIALLLPLVLSSPAGAQEPFFYEGTRPMSLGGAFIALADDECAVFHNPAGLARIASRRSSLSGYIQQYSWTDVPYAPENINPNFTDRGFCVAYVQRGFGLSLSRTGKGWWEQMTFHSIDIGDEDVYVARPVNWESCAAASYAREILPRLCLGLTAKYIHFSHFSDTDVIGDGDAATFDAGAVYEPAARLSVGVSLRNAVSTPITYAVYNDYSSIAFPSRLPLGCAAGIAWKPIETVSVAADVRHIFQDDVKNDRNAALLEFKRSYHIGCEWRPAGWLAMRAGYSRGERPVHISYPAVPFDASASDYEYRAYDSLSLGVGFERSGLSLDVCVKYDDRKSWIEEDGLTIRDTTALGSAVLAYSF